MKQIKNIIYVIVSTLYKKEIFHINKCSFFLWVYVDFSYNRLLNKNNIYYWIWANLRLQKWLVL
jgi:hypothetical protein